MKTRNNSRTRWRSSRWPPDSLSSLPCGRRGKCKPFRTHEDFPSDFGFVELGAGQTARLNVVNVGDPDTVPDQEPRLADARLAFDVYVQDPENSPNCGGIVPVPPCLTRYRFLRRESREVELMPGQAASFDFVGVRSAQRSTPPSTSLGGPDTLPGEAGAHRSHTSLRRLKCVRVRAPSLLFPLSRSSSTRSPTRPASGREMHGFWMAECGFENQRFNPPSESQNVCD